VETALEPAAETAAPETPETGASEPTSTEEA
jgi:hypothetical protein